MTDFAIAIDNMPADSAYGGDEEVLRAALVQHFESVIKKYLERFNVCTDFSPTSPFA